MKILNPGSSGDFHIHSANFSDGFCSIDELVAAAGELSYRKIAITDHSQALLDSYGMARKTHYDIISSGRWKNIHNEVEVIFGVEADLLNVDGDVCDNIQGVTPEFLILSAHEKAFNGDKSQIKSAYINAINRYGHLIKILGHLCTRRLADYLNEEDIIQIVDIANANGIAVELNCASLAYGKTNIYLLKVMLDNARLVYVNSDAHTMN